MTLKGPPKAHRVHNDLEAFWGLHCGGIQAGGHTLDALGQR